MMATEIVMHFIVPAPVKAPAPHMISGEPNVPALRTFAQAQGGTFGHQGVNYSFACDPKLVSNDRHRGSGEPWALLAVIRNEAVIDPSACPACLATEAWKKAIAENPHPLVRKEEVGAISQSGCCG
jgi:hypothetical protein